MARDWSEVKMMFEFGKSLNDIAIKTGFNKGSISKKAKKEGWQKNEKATLVIEETENIIKGNEIATQKATYATPIRQLHDLEVKNELDKRSFKNIIEQNTADNQELVGVLQSQMNTYIQDDIKECNQNGKKSNVAIELAASIMAASKITEVNSKIIFGITQPKEETVSDDKIIFDMNYGDGK